MRVRNSFYWIMKRSYNILEKKYKLQNLDRCLRYISYSVQYMSSLSFFIWIFLHFCIHVPSNFIDNVTYATQVSSHWVSQTADRQPRVASQFSYPNSRRRKSNAIFMTGRYCNLYFDFHSIPRLVDHESYLLHGMHPLEIVAPTGGPSS